LSFTGVAFFAHNLTLVLNVLKTFDTAQNKYVKARSFRCFSLAHVSAKPAVDVYFIIFPTFECHRQELPCVHIGESMLRVGSAVGIRCVVQRTTVCFLNLRVCGLFGIIVCLLTLLFIYFSWISVPLSFLLLWARYREFVKEYLFSPSSHCERSSRRFGSVHFGSLTRNAMSPVLVTCTLLMPSFCPYTSPCQH
jgi:hypothetical protein